MEGLNLIEGEALKKWHDLLNAILSNQLVILQRLDKLDPSYKEGAVPDFISVDEAAAKYKTSDRTIRKKVLLFRAEFKREIDRIWSGGKHLINEQELLQALRLKSPHPVIKKGSKDTSKGRKAA